MPGESSAVLLAALVLAVSLALATDRPIIGILAQELNPSHNFAPEGRESYIAAGYVKAVEGSGARVVPIFINQTEDYYKKILSSINGLLFPGGDSDLGAPFGYGATGRILYNMVLKMQDAGVSFPVLGVCQGLELLIFLASKASAPHEVLVPCNASNAAMPLNFRPGFLESSLYRMASPEILDILKTQAVTSNHHIWCVVEKKMKEFNLDESWRVLSTNLDLGQVEFVSSTEHYNRPIVGVQFHPEKNMYEWNPNQSNPHSRKAILSARLFYDWLVLESKGNNQTFPDKKQESEALMYNYSPTFTGGARGGYDEQVYFF